MKKLKIDLLYGSQVLTLPAACLERLPQADAGELKVLLWLSDPAARGEVDLQDTADALQMTPDEVSGAIQFWRGAGILKKSEAKKAAADPALLRTEGASAEPVPTAQSTAAEEAAPADRRPRANVTIVRSDDGMPHYTAEEITRIFAENSELSGMIDECQNIFGKLFSPTEVNRIMALTEYFRLDCEYILLLCYYCKKIDKASVPYLDKLARSLYSEGVDQVDQLGDRLGELEAAADLGSYYRTLLGAGKRSFTDKESKFLAQWVKWCITPDLLKVAYEVSVDATGAPSMPYINKVLSNWKEAGYTTAEQVKTAMEDYRRKKETKAAGTPNNSFATDEFFEAALKRSLALHEG